MNTNLNKLINNIYSESTNQIVTELCGERAEIYLVGGYIRDAILGKESHDKDYVVAGMSAIKFAKEVAAHVEGFFVLLDPEFGIARVVMPDKINYLDFAGCYGKDIYEDLNRRDFTINSIAIKINGQKPEILDPNNGIKDIENKIVRAISEKNLIDDPLRSLRAFRFSSQLGFEIDNETNIYIEKHLNLIENVANERVHAELIKLFEGHYCSQNLIKMKDNGLLFKVFPDLEAQMKVPPNLHHHLNLIDHSMETVRQIESMLSTMPAWVQDHLNTEQANGIKYISLLKIGALLHDLGKPDTWQIDEEGRHRFIKHDEVGAEIGIGLLKQLKFSKNANKYITNLIRYHIYPSQLIREDEPATEKAMHRMFRKLEAETPDVIFLAMADRLSARGVEISDDIVQRNLNGLRFFLEEYKKSKEKIDSLPKLLTGNDVMEILNLPKSPEVGKVLKALKEAQISGDVNTKDEAVAFIKGFEFNKNE